MEKKFTRAMVCSALDHKCKECPLHYCNNSTALHCWELTNDNVNTIMKDYPYADVKVRMIFNDIETRLTAVEERVSNNVSVEFKPERIVFGCSYNRNFNDFSAEVVDKKLYNKLEAKHEADCRLISEYDLEIKKLEDQNTAQNDIVCDLYSNLCTEQKERIRCEAVIEDLKSDAERWVKRYKELEYMYEKKDAECNSLEDKYRRYNADLKSRLFDLKNVENERDHYKGLYSSKCDEYDKLLEKQLKTEKDFTFYRNAYMESISELEETNEKQHDFKEKYIKLTEQKDNYKSLFHSLNHKHQKVVGEMKSWKDRATTAEKELDYLKMKNEKPSVLRLALETENKALRETLEHVTEDRDKLKSECYLAQEALKTTKEKLKETEEKFNDACILNETRKAVFEANLKLKKKIEAKDREIGLLRAELDKYKTDDECDDSWID